MRAENLMLFQDRQDAGRQLAQRLLRYQQQKPFVVALPRGGVVVAYEVAKALNAPLDVLVVRKLGVPGQPELGMGAIAPNGVRILNHHLIQLFQIPKWQIEKVTGHEIQEMERRLVRYRRDRPMPNLQGRTVILVDDGLATGFTARAAIQVLHQMHPRKIILAVPVCSPDIADKLRREVDELISITMPVDFMGVGAWYRYFAQTSDEEVIKLLQLAKAEIRV